MTFQKRRDSHMEPNSFHLRILLTLSLLNLLFHVGCASGDREERHAIKPTKLSNSLGENEIYTYNELATRDLDNMANLVRLRVKKSQSLIVGKEAPLKEALRLVYARPSKDGMIEKIIPPVRSGLEELELWEKANMELINEALLVLNSPKGVSPRVQVTYAFILENMISEFKPKIDKIGFEKKAVEKIALGRIKVTPEAMAERRLSMMDDVVSPSEIATYILSEKDEQWDKANGPGDSLQNGIGVKKKDDSKEAKEPTSETPISPVKEKN